MTSRRMRRYQALGERYLRSWVPGQIAALGVLAVAGSVLITRYVDLRGWDVVGAALVGIAGVTASTLVAAWRVLRAVEPAQAWLRAGRPAGADVEEAWRCVAGLPGRAVREQAVAALLLGVVPWSAWVAAAAGLSVAEAGLVAVATVAACSFPTLVFLCLYAQFVRPLLLDVARRLPPGFVPETRPLLRRRLLGVLFAANVAAGTFLGLVTTVTGNAEVNRLAGELAAALGVASTLSLLICALLVESILEPVDELLSTATRVRDGDVEARVPIVSADELGLLAQRLNLAVDALAERSALRERTVALEAQASRERRMREAELTRAAQLERVRVARELHDVVAHALTVMVVQASAAQGAVDDVPRRVEAIRRSSLEALEEMRRLVGVLRPQEEPEDTATHRRGLREIGELVEALRAAGLQVVLRREGESSLTAPVPPLVDLSGWRILQEACTNVLKHAGASRVEITVRRDPGEVVLEVVDDGGGGAPPTVASGGHGLVGMRERAVLLGGELSAGPRADGAGFVVRARLPLRTAALAGGA